jgi:regulator of protease activity HflC (stomatin/prohibitin superfamily)
MEFLNKPRTWVILGVVVVAVVLLYEGFWVWEVERVEVGPGEFLVVTSLWGKDLADGEIIAPDHTYKGIQLEVKSEGRHFINPLFYTYERKPILEVPPDECLVLTRKYGKEIPPERLARGDVLARDGERGLVQEVLLPGKHRVNPYAYETERVKAIKVTAEQVGVHTLKVGKDPSELPDGKRRSPYVVPEGYRGVQDKPLPKGTYYVNTYVEKIVPINVREHYVDFQDIVFPSKDGFTLNPHVLVTYQVQAEKAPELFVLLCNEGQLRQEDGTREQKDKNEILQKIVLPLIRGYVRIEGSKYEAREFITSTDTAADPNAANLRMRLQRELERKVKPPCDEAGITIVSIALDKLVTENNKELNALSRQISERVDARTQLNANTSKIAELKTQQELKATEALSKRSEETVAAKTRLDVATRVARQRKDVEESKLKQELAAAELRLEAARAQAKSVLAAGKAEADVINLQNEAEVSGLRKAIQGFASADQFAQAQVLARLAPALKEIFASDTSDFARLFAGYMTPPPAKLGGAPVAPGEGGAAQDPKQK